MASDGTRTGRIEAALRQVFSPAVLAIRDESALHEGHAGASPGGETHFHVSMESARFAGLGRLARARAVHEALASEFASGLHALSLKLRAPGEINTEN
jgi:BolA protein